MADGQTVEMPYVLIHARLGDAAGRPMTAWNLVRYPTSAANPTTNGPVIGLGGQVY